MRIGNLVMFNKTPGPNTPGRPTSGYSCTGVVVAESSGNANPEAFDFFDGSKWCEVLWSNNQTTRCYKDDLSILDRCINNFESNLF